MDVSCIIIITVIFANIWFDFKGHHIWKGIVIIMKKSQKSLVKTIMLLFNILLVTFSVNCFWLIQDTRKFWLIPVLLITFLLANIMPIFFGKQFPSFQIRVCNHGVLCLKMFLISSFISVLYHIVAAFYLFPARWTVWMWSAVVCICAEAVVFWNGLNGN